MPLRPFAPGTRKGNRYWLLRGTVDGGEPGRRYEIPTRLPPDTPARQLALAVQDAEREIRAEYTNRRAPRPGEAVSFSKAAELYVAWRDPGLADLARLAKVESVLGRRMIADIAQVELVEAANLLFPGRTAATRNREVLRPALAVLHYAAKAGLVAWARIEIFPEKRPEARAVSIETAALLVNAALPGPQRLYLLWSFKQGTRISVTLRMEWGNIDLARQVVRFRDGKTDRDLELPLDPEVFEALANTPESERSGPLFPWRLKNGVYRWVRPLARKLGVRFRPHDARHSLGSWHNDAGSGPRTIMDALGHSSQKSSMRYQATNTEGLRTAAARIPRLGKREGG